MQTLSFLTIPSDMQENIYFLNQAVASWTNTDKTLHQIVKTAIDSEGEKQQCMAVVLS